MGVIDNELNWRGVRPVPGINGIWPAPSAIRISESDGIGGAGVKIIYTVPANKKLYLGSAFLSSYNDAAAVGNSNLYIRDDEDVFQYSIGKHHYFQAGQMATSFLFTPAMEALAGWDVCAKGLNAASYSYGGFSGWIEDA